MTIDMGKMASLFAGWKVVIADDEEDSLMVTMMLLEMAGAEVISASNGREALQLIRTHHPHLVISDISMPELDGWGLIHALNTDRTLEDIPAVALTAHAMPGDRTRAIQAGFANYISKPLDPDKFVQQLVALVVSIPKLDTMTQGMQL